MLLKTNESVKKIKKEIKKYLERNKSESTTIQNLWDTAKAVPREEFIVIQASGDKKNLKQPSLTLKGTRKRTNKTQSW